MLRSILPSSLRRKKRPSPHESNHSDEPPPHALDTLPTLHHPRRPITPSPHPNPQPHSPFFTLPPELRIEILRLLFSRREIHLDMRYSSTETRTPHSTKGAYMDPSRRWRWRSSTCHRHPLASPLFDKCSWGGPPPTACDQFDTPCGIGAEVMGMLLSCRLAYREVVHVLYAENTFHVSTGAVLLFTERLLARERTAAVRSLVFNARVESLTEYAAEHLGLEEPGWPAYEVLVGRIPVAFPSLRRLTVVFPCRAGRGLLKVVEGEGEGGGDVMRRRITAPMDGVVAAFGSSLEECLLIVDGTAFDAHFRGDGHDIQEQGQGERLMNSPGDRVTDNARCMWRSVSDVVGEEDNVSVSEVGNVKGVGEGGLAGTGYWVRGASENFTTREYHGVFMHQGLELVESSVDHVF